MHTSFAEWLTIRDPELSERFGLNTMSKAARWTAKKAIPFTIQAGMTLADPVSIISPQSPDKPVSPNRELSFNMDDYMASRAERKRLKLRDTAKRNSNSTRSSQKYGDEDLQNVAAD